MSRYQMIQTRWIGIAWFIASSLSSVASGCLSNKCGKCPLTMLIYCGLVGSDLHGPTVTHKNFSFSFITFVVFFSVFFWRG